MLIATERGNYLWDCVAFLDDATETEIRKRGGLQAIAISHPHFYASMVTWADRFDVPVFVHEADREYVSYPSRRIQYWSGVSLELGPGLTAVNLGGHFPGSAALVWSRGAGGKGVLLAGDSVKPVMDRRYVSFMYSIVNLIPLSARRVRDIVARLEPYEFDRIYSLWRDHVVPRDGKESVRRSAERYIHHLEID
jgi:glyoxylase-like metal-dependent hydrolase (beta-lactamase superfamily II)